MMKKNLKIGLVSDGKYGTRAFENIKQVFEVIWILVPDIPSNVMLDDDLDLSDHDSKQSDDGYNRDVILDENDIEEYSEKKKWKKDYDKVVKSLNEKNNIVYA